jgi:hypothetical protein
MNKACEKIFLKVHLRRIDSLGIEFIIVHFFVSYPFGTYE